jgi:flagellar biosynthesis GTPase FlhF
MPKAFEKSENEKKLEAALKMEKTKSALREKIIRCRAMVEGMIERDMIKPSEVVAAQSEREGMSPIDARNAGMKAAIDEKMADMLKMDDSSLNSFSKLVNGMNKEASKKDVLSTMPLIEMKEESNNWMEKLPWS